MTIPASPPAAQPQPETQLLMLRRHGRVLVLPVLILLAVAATAGFFVGRFDESWQNLVAGLGAVAVAVLLGAAPILSWLTNRVTITNRRVIVRRGLLVNRRTELPLSRVREVRVRRGPVQRMFGSGHIDLVVGADAPTRLRDLPGVVKAVDVLHELIEQNYLVAATRPQGFLDETTALPRA